MTAPLIAAALSLCLLVVLCGPPFLALRMLWLRLRRGRAGGRLVYMILFPAVAFLLLFNALFALGQYGPLKALSPPLMAQNPGASALLFAWAAVGLCLLLAVVAPRRGGTTRI